jgi:DNA-binding MarR family transcriptional regulator
MDAMHNHYGVAPESDPGQEAGRGAGLGRTAPQLLQDLGLPALFLGQLTLKHCFYMDFFTLGDLAERLKVSASIISGVLEYLKKSRWVEVRGPDPMHPAVNALSLAHRHSLTEAGRRQAAQLLEYDAYAGPAPVVLKDYWQQVTRQSIGMAAITPDHVQRALKGLVLSAEILEQVGVAAVSGRPLFLYGPAGNGKTIISQHLGRIWEDEILVPYAIFVDGQVIQVFDEITHARSREGDSGGGERTSAGCGAAGQS